MLSTNQKGAIAESKITAAAIDLGIELYRPVFEGGRFDMIFAFQHGELMRVQCKWANRVGDVVVIRAYSARRARDGLRHRAYTVAEIDALAAYCPQNDRCYLLPAALVDGRRAFSLRLAPSRNNQVAGIMWAEQYELGAIAQLGERVTGSHEVAGSSPASSMS
jgi:hypothetical protein